MSDLKCAYGVTTMPDRAETLLKQSLASLSKAGFSEPWLFVDDPHVSHLLELPATTRHNIGPMGHWWLSLWELFIRNPHADRYALFQDDILCCADLREYVERWYPECGYLNLITWPNNLQGIQPEDPQGWFKAPRNGKGAQGLVLDHDAVEALFAEPRIVKKFQELKNPRKSLDGAVRDALDNAGYREWVHNPSLLYHTGAMGKTSIEGNLRKQPYITSFLGEDFSPLGIERSESCDA